MITVKLTRKEAEALVKGVICSELEREGCPEQYDELMGKNFHKILDSACIKLNKAIKADSFGVPPSKLEEKQSEMLRSWGVPKA